MKMKSMALFGILLVCVLTGCGGGGGSQWPISGNGRLQSGDNIAVDLSYIDDIAFTSPKDGYVTVTMSSSDIDSYVLVYRSTDGSNRLGSDDDSGPGVNANYTFYASKDVTYTARFTTYSSGAKIGNYSYTIGDSSQSSSVQYLSNSSEAHKQAVNNDTKTEKM